MLDDTDRHASFCEGMNQPFHQMGLTAVFYPAHTEEHRTPDGTVVVRRIDIAQCLPAKAAEADIHILCPDAREEFCQTVLFLCNQILYGRKVWKDHQKSRGIL